MKANQIVLDLRESEKQGHHHGLLLLTSKTTFYNERPRSAQRFDNFNFFLKNFDILKIFKYFDIFKIFNKFVFFLI